MKSLVKIYFMNNFKKSKTTDMFKKNVIKFTISS